FAAALGGAGNLAAVEACTTRLRLQVRDQGAVNEAALRALGARGFVRPGPDLLQVVLGPQADQVAGEIRASLAPPAIGAAAGSAAQAIAAAAPDADFRNIEVCDGRLRLRLPAGARLDEAALRRIGLRGLFRKGDRLHLLVGPGAAGLAEQLAAGQAGPAAS
ncbi:MAG: PTS transporter subunit EIIB, partial [Phenylobacterium sp.]